MSLHTQGLSLAPYGMRGRPLRSAHCTKYQARVVVCFVDAAARTSCPLLMPFQCSVEIAHERQYTTKEDIAISISGQRNDGLAIPQGGAPKISALPVKVPHLSIWDRQMICGI